MCDDILAEQSRPPFLLGEWHVEPTLLRIWRGNEVVQVAPRVMQVLLCLAAQPGAVVSKRQLIDTVWRRQFVSEAALTRSVANLRRILGDDARRPQYVENIPRLGYRLVMAVGPDSEHVPSRCDRGALCWISLSERRFLLADGDNLIGRGPDAAVRIDSRKVSRRHARVRVDGVRATIEDLGSTNGTFVDGRAVAGSRELRDGDRIAVGPAVLEFRVHDPDGSTESARQGQ